jgi:hypothetical protein
MAAEDARDQEKYGWKSAFYYFLAMLIIGMGVIVWFFISLE